jgi:phosphoadenosine phosphosulfate reductase
MRVVSGRSLEGGGTGDEPSRGPGFGRFADPPSGRAAVSLARSFARSKHQAAALEARFGHLDAREALERAIFDLFPGRIALTSSFGADSAVLLHLVSRIAPDTPVLFLDTGKLFPETIAYRDALIARLKLTDVRSVNPLPARIAEVDPSGYLWSVEPDQCCAVRKVEPLAQALEGFDAWITGRKRFQAITRAQLPVFEQDQQRIKVNPLATWGEADVTAYMQKHDLPRHPLVARGYASIGCATCTTPVAPGEPSRAGRWRNRGKTECGIHNRPKRVEIQRGAGAE